MSMDWATGIFEGEGCISVRPNDVELIVQMVDKDVMERFVETVGAGTLRLNDRVPGQPIYRWRTARWKEVLRILEEMYPLLGERRAAKAAHAMDKLRSKYHLSS